MAQGSKSQEKYQVVQAVGGLLFSDFLGAHVNKGEIIIAPKPGEAGLSYQEAMLLVNQGTDLSLNMNNVQLVSDC